MNKVEFISLIDNPKNLDKSHITALKNIASDFPYFQASHMLLSKALFNENHYEFEKYLKSTALIVSDRELLYRFLHDIDFEEIIDEPNFVRSVEQEIVEITEVINQQIHEDETVAEQVSETLIEPEQNDSIQQIETVVENFEPEIFHHKKDEKYSFTEWLLLGSEKLKEEIIENKFSEKIEETEKFDSIENSKPSSNIHEFESILDKFIRENPSISRPKSEFYNPASMAKQSNEDDDDLATETLANIYYKQGAYKKAIRTYEKLCLIYPHKMSYFADLIQKIKQENKND